MGNRITTQMLADRLRQNGQDANQVDAFVDAFFKTLSEGVTNDGVVKVKGLGTFKTILLVTVARGIVCILIFVGLVFASVPLMTVALACAGLTTGGTPVCSASFAATAFGPDHYAKNLSCLNLSTIPAALIGPMITSFSLSLTGSYEPGLLLGAALIIVGIVATFITKKLLARLQ